MNKKRLLLYAFMTIIIATGWFAYEKTTDDTYEGMSIIPEKQKDIPLFEGLKPTNHEYLIAGNQSENIYTFYKHTLPTLGWKLEDEQTELNDNEWTGFNSQWRKEDFNGELWISGNYNQFDKKTEVIFDKIPIHTSTVWIEGVPENICIYKSLNEEECIIIKDDPKITQIKTIINKAIDANIKKIPKREKISMIDFGNIDIKVYYENDKEVYFQSANGIKLMKPEPEFFELINSPNS
ncbi:hypothetical protein [Lederbergia graminis]|uniref:Uncharacterized protein n=1 Tax=Lederbergia graminis TaxID=735518 RepID=A0ABW0LPP9_9BACI